MEHQTIDIDGDSYSLYSDTEGKVLPDLTEADWRDKATDVYADGGCFSVYTYDLGGGLTLYVDCDQGVIISLAVSRETIAAHLADWDWSTLGYPSLAEWIASMSLDGLSVLQIPPEGYEGQCAIWREPNYYPGTDNAPRPGLDREEMASGRPTENVLVFSNYAAAAQYVAEYYSAPSEYDGIPACHVLSHGQAGADRLTIVQWE